MNQKERDWLVVLSGVKARRMTLKAASQVMEVSYRQAKRLWRRYTAQGAAGLVHRLRGRPSNNRGRADDRRARALALYQEDYPGFGPTLAAEQMAQREGLVVDHDTLRGWLIATGLWQVRHDRGRRHRRWRPRKEHPGEMVQMDGSDHDWFEGRGPRCVLMVLIDDATGWTWGRFVQAETTEAAFLALRDYTRQRGLPRSLYVDRDSIYVVNRVATAGENLENTGPLTQFARAMRELDVELIKAHSPQAKGRVERMNGTLQDRLVKLLRLEGIGDLAAANAYLAQTFWPEHNARFTVAAALGADVHRPAPPGEELARVLSVQETRVVANDYCVRWANRFFQLEGSDANLGLRGQKILVRQKLDRVIELEFRGRRLRWRELTTRPAQPQRPQLTLVQRVAAHRASRVPGPAHPWRGPVRPAVAATAGGPLRSGRARSARPPCAPGATRGKGTFLPQFN
jgi:hypothetical protein